MLEHPLTMNLDNSSKQYSNAVIQLEQIIGQGILRTPTPTHQSHDGDLDRSQQQFKRFRISGTI